MLDNVKIRPATSADLDTAYNGQRPYSGMAWAVEYGGALVSVIGVARIHHGYLAVWDEFYGNGVKPSARAIYTVAKMIVERLSKEYKPLYVVATPTVATAERFLRKLGFFADGKMIGLRPLLLLGERHVRR
jgi:hypothetical protein